MLYSTLPADKGEVAQRAGTALRFIKNMLATVKL